MRILADENIPFLDTAMAVLREHAGVADIHLQTMPGRDIGAGDIADVEVLLLRSVTRLSRDMIEGSALRFVGTCTIGVDHLDTEALDDAGIAWANAPGCNANAVGDYVLSALLCYPEHLADLRSQQARAGIVGYGNVGSRLHQRFSQLGIACGAYDPLLDSAACPIKVEKAALQRCALLCLHAPLTKQGGSASFGQFDADFLAALPPNALIISAGRGGVVRDSELKKLKALRPDIRLVLDVWENEPNIDTELMALADIATPHIAGYSLDGKVNGLAQVLAALAECLSDVLPGVLADVPPRTLEEAFRRRLQLEQAQLTKTEGAAEVSDVLRQIYDLRRDDAALRAEPSAFDRLRKQYPLRREYAFLRDMSADLDADVLRACLDFAAPAK